MKWLCSALLFVSVLAAQPPLRLSRHAGLPPIHAGNAVAVGDVDGDGYPDVVFGNGAFPNQLLLNDGRGRFRDATAGRLDTPAVNATTSVDLVDLDGDGDLDLLVGNGEALSNRVYRNDGGYFTDITAQALPPNQGSTRNQVVADLDGDGDVDWLMVDDPLCRMYVNDGTGVFGEVTNTHLHLIPADLGDASQMAIWGDIDGDGDLDVLIPNVSAMPLLVENMGYGQLRPHPVQLPFVVGGCRFNKFVDVDNDGDLDLFLDRTRVLLVNQGDGTFVNTTPTAFPSVHQQTLAVFDADGDGFVDVISPNVFWRNDGTGRFVGTATPATNLANLLAFAAADFDGDGDIDAPPFLNFRQQVDAPTPPVLGGTYAVDFHTRPGTQPFVVAMAALQGITVPVPPYGMLRLDQATTVTLGVRRPQFSPTRFAWQIPNQTALLGLELHYQALIDDLQAPPRLSNGLLDVVQ
mgnify:CR=1 FL=1|jgi:hypothetical protein